MRHLGCYEVGWVRRVGGRGERTNERTNERRQRLKSGGNGGGGEDDDASGLGGEIVGERDKGMASGDVGDEEGEPGERGTEKKPFDVVFVVDDVSSAKTGAECGPV